MSLRERSQCRPVGNIFGKSRQRGEILVVAAAMATRVDQQHRESCCVQRRNYRPHHGGVGAPAMHRQHGWGGRWRRLRRRNQPAEQLPAAGSRNANLLHRIRRESGAVRRAPMGQARRAQSVQDGAVRKRTRAPQASAGCQCFDDHGCAWTGVLFIIAAGLRPWPGTGPPYWRCDGPAIRAPRSGSAAPVAAPAAIAGS